MLPVAQSTSLNSVVVQEAWEQVPPELWAQICASQFQFDGCINACRTAMRLGATNKWLWETYNNNLTGFFGELLLKYYFPGPYAMTPMPKEVTNIPAWRLSLIKDWVPASRNAPENLSKGEFDIENFWWCPKSVAVTHRGNDHFIIKPDGSVVWYDFQTQKQVCVLKQGKQGEDVVPLWSEYASLALTGPCLVSQQMHSTQTTSIWNLMDIRKGVDKATEPWELEHCFGMQVCGSIGVVAFSEYFDKDTGELRGPENCIVGFDLETRKPLDRHRLSAESLSVTHLQGNWCVHDKFLCCIPDNELKVRIWEVTSEGFSEIEPIVGFTDLTGDRSLCRLKSCGDQLLIFSLGCPIFLYDFTSCTLEKISYVLSEVRPGLQIEDRMWYYGFGPYIDNCFTWDGADVKQIPERTRLGIDAIAHIEADAHKVFYLSQKGAYFAHDYRGLPKLSFGRLELEISIETLQKLQTDLMQWKEKVAALPEIFQEHLRLFPLQTGDQQWTALNQVLAEAWAELLLHVLCEGKDQSQQEQKATLTEIVSKLYNIDPSYLSGYGNIWPKFNIPAPLEDYVHDAVSLLLSDRDILADKLHMVQDFLKDLKQSWCLAGLGIVTHKERHKAFPKSETNLSLMGIQSVEDVHLLGVDMIKEPLIDPAEALNATLLSCVQRLDATTAKWEKIIATMDIKHMSFRGRAEVDYLVAEFCLVRIMIENLKKHIPQSNEPVRSADVKCINNCIQRYNACKTRFETFKIFAYLHIQIGTKDVDPLIHIADWWHMLRDDGIQTLSQLKEADPNKYAEIMSKLLQEPKEPTT